MTAICIERRKTDPDWMAEKIAVWQHDFDVIRDRQPLWLGGLIRRRLRVLPPPGEPSCTVRSVLRSFS